MNIVHNILWYSTGIQMRRFTSILKPMLFFSFAMISQIKCGTTETNFALPLMRKINNNTTG